MFDSPSEAGSPLDSTRAREAPSSCANTISLVGDHCLPLPTSVKCFYHVTKEPSQATLLQYLSWPGPIAIGPVQAFSIVIGVGACNWWWAAKRHVGGAWAISCPHCLLPV
jgi:hypothetical protein